MKPLKNKYRFRVFEVNASDDLSKLKTLIGEASQSYGLSKSGKTLELPLIFVDEFDAGFEDDPNFLATIRQVVRTSRAPVIFSCDDVLPSVVSSNGIDLDYRTIPAEVVRFKRPSIKECVRKLTDVTRKEGLSMFSQEDLIKLVRTFQGDLRRCLNHLHCWGSRSIEKLRELKSLFDEDVVVENESILSSSKSNEEDHEEELTKMMLKWKQDGLEEVLYQGEAPEVHSISPNKLRDATKSFKLTGRHFGLQDSKEEELLFSVLVDSFTCAESALVARDVIQGRLVKKDNATLDESMESNRSSPFSSSNDESAFEPDEEQQESELEDDDFEPLRKSAAKSQQQQQVQKGGGRKKKSLMKHKFISHPSVIVERPFLVRVNGDDSKTMTIVRRSDESLAFRFNSLFVCEDDSSMPFLHLDTLQWNLKPNSTTKNVVCDITVDLNQARENVISLQQMWKRLDGISLGETLCLKRRGFPDKVDSVVDSQTSYSAFDDLGDDEISRWLNYDKETRRRGVKVDNESARFIQKLRGLCLRIDHQSSSCFHEDIPIYIRMCRLDIMKRAQHTGRRRLSSYFARSSMDWLDVPEVCKLGLDQDMGFDLGMIDDAL